LLQPYYDIAKSFRKETVLPGDAGPAFRAAPYVSIACYLTVPLLIPVLTTFPLQLGYMGDILGGGFLLGLASFSVSLAALDTGTPYTQMGSSRLRSFGALGEPTILVVVFTVALITHTDLPYAMVKTLEASATEVARPAHLLAAAAFFLVLLSETGRIPVESHGSTLEFGMIEEARTLEHSGPGLALLRWGSSMKQMILFVLFLNVLVVPWGLSPDRRVDHVLLAIGFLALKAVVLALVVVAIESSFAKLRLYKIPEFTVAGFLLAVLAVITFVFQGRFEHTPLSVFSGTATVIAVAVLLLEFAMLRSHHVWELLRLYGLSSLLIGVLAVSAAATGHNGGLYVLGAITIGFKALAIPFGVGMLLRRLEVPARVPSAVGAPTAVLTGIVLSAIAFYTFSQLSLPASRTLPLAALGVAVAAILVGFLIMIVRPHAPSQLLGFLAVENGATLASLVVAPGLPLILAVLLVFDVLIGVVVFVVLVQYLAMERRTVSTHMLDRLRG
ncbi:MAG TPA: NADH-quinone oxidoreductase subunit H, partial [Gaiellales bacterium]|nr:NADH-quinone oxidoreductase subunit H [Gaiellales bacterium]